MTATSSQGTTRRRWADPDHAGLHWRRVKGGIAPTIMLKIGGELRYKALPLGTSKSDALRELRSMKVERDNGQAPIAKALRLDAVAESAFDGMQAKVVKGRMSARTLALYRQRWASHLQPRLGRRKLSEITKASVIKLAADLQRSDLSESTAHGVLIVLRSILRHARHIDAMTLDPFAGIDPSELPSPSGSSDDQRVLREREVRRLIEATLPSYRAIVTLLSWSGLRVSEALALRWEDVSFVDDCFDVTGQLAPSKRGEAPEVVKPKSARGPAHGALPADRP